MRLWFFRRYILFCLCLLMVLVDGRFSALFAVGTPGTNGMIPVRSPTGDSFLNLQQISGSPFSAGSGPANVSYSPVVSGNLFAAVPNYFSNTVSVYRVDLATGAFTLVDTPATGPAPALLEFSPLVSGNLFAGVVNAAGNTVSVYRVNQTTGVFTAVPGSPFPTGVQPYSISFSPVISGNLFAAVTNASSNTVSVYLVNQTTGAFTPVPGSPFLTGTAPYLGSFSSIVSGNLFYAAPNHQANTLSVYSVNPSTGAFTPASTVPAGSNPYNIAFSPIVSGNLFAIVSNLNDNTVSLFLVNQLTGAFAQVAGSPFSAGMGPNFAAFSPLVNGSLVAAVANFNTNNVSAYSVDPSTGFLTQLLNSPYASGANPDGMAFSPLVAGKVFAATANFGDMTTSVYQLLYSNWVINLDGYSLKNQFLNKTELINTLKWDAPIGESIIQYNVFRGSLNRLIGVVEATSSQLQFRDCNVKHGVTYTYYVEAVDAAGNVSAPSQISIKTK